jgi:serine protease Do
MKKLILNLVIAATGGFIALGGTYFYYSKIKSKNVQIQSEMIQPNYSLVGNFVNSSGANFDFTNAAEKSVNSVVHIKTTSEHVNNLNYDPFTELFFGPQSRQQNYLQQGSGSGVIISADGYIVTNNHVINGADKIEVILNNKKAYDAKVIGTDPSTDVALVKIDENSLPFLSYGNSEAVKVGEWVLAVGNPFNLESTVTAGIISAKGRSNILDNSKRPIESFIQTDAAVNPGNSGGALVNTNGELVGINTAIASNNGAYQGYSFAVPVNIVKKVVSDLIEFGIVQRAYIGVSIRDIDSKFAKEKGLSQLNGIYINGIADGGSAHDAGMQEGDVITKIQNVNVGSISAMQEQLSKYRPGDKINVTVLRENREKELNVVLKTLNNTTKLVKKSELVKSTISALGADFVNAEEDVLKRLRLSSGVRVEKLYNGKLAQVGIKEGFIITSIDRKKVSQPKDIEQILSDKTGVISLQGYYPNGLGITYQFDMK